MSTLIPQLTNHIGFVIDASGSMGHLKEKVVSVFDAQIDALRKRSQELNQETRVSVYFFNDHIKCVVFDMDVMRPISLKSLYRPGGSTALIDATILSMADLDKVPQIHSDHAFLLYVITDGQENISKTGVRVLTDKLERKGAELNWTIAALVPDRNGHRDALKFGFLSNNVEIWDATTERGLGEASTSISKATDAFMVNRSKGVRSTRNLFSVDTSHLTANTVRTKLDRVPENSYHIYPVLSEGEVIAPFVEKATGKTYRTGEAFYLLTKAEKIQASKQIAIRDRKDGAIYRGLNARNILSLPATHEVKAAPGSFKDYEVFIQSNSVNRKLVRGSYVLVFNN